MLWATVGGSRLPSNLLCRCGRLSPDWWRCPAVTGVNSELACTLQLELTCGVKVRKLLYLRPTEYPETDTYQVLVF